MKINEDQFLRFSGLETLSYQEFAKRYSQEDPCILFKDVPAVLKELNGRIKDGDQYLACDVDIREGISSPLSDGMLVTFNDAYSAAEYGYENSTDIDVTRVTRIDAIVRGLNAVEQITDIRSKLNLPGFEGNELLNIPALVGYAFQIEQGMKKTKMAEQIKASEGDVGPLAKNDKAISYRDPQREPVIRSRGKGNKL